MIFKHRGNNTARRNDYYKENEPTDLFVLEDYRAIGYERKLLAKALELNQPNGMMILLDVNDEHAITLFESMGFAKAQGQNNLTAHWTVPEPGKRGPQYD